MENSNKNKELADSIQDARKKAEELLQQKEELDKVLNQTVVKVRKQREKLQNRWGDIELLIKLIRAYSNGEYRRIPWKMLLAAMVAVIYFLNPFDVIPDLLGFVGFVDDIAVIAFVIGAFQEELDEFRGFLETGASDLEIPLNNETAPLNGNL